MCFGSCIIMFHKIPKSYHISKISKLVAIALAREVSSFPLSNTLGISATSFLSVNIMRYIWCISHANLLQFNHSCTFFNLRLPDYILLWYPYQCEINPCHQQIIRGRNIWKHLANKWYTYIQRVVHSTHNIEYLRKIHKKYTNDTLFSIKSFSKLCQPTSITTNRVDSYLWNPNPNSSLLSLKRSIRRSYTNRAILKY